MRSHIKPPPKVSIPTHQPSFLNRNEPPKLSNWQREGYPSEFAYAKALGLLEVPKVSNESENYSNYNAYDSIRNDKNHIKNSSDFESDVMRQMKEFEENFRSAADLNSNGLPEVIK